MPRFCIVTPTIPGRERLLAAAIQSVKAQTFHDYVHVVCGDGESLASEQVARSFGATWTSIPKAGNWGYACRNHVVRNWDADYFMFLDDDNVYFNNCLEEVSKEIDASGMAPFLAMQIVWIARWMDPPPRVLLPTEPEVKKGYYDQMCSIVRSDIAKRIEFKPTYEQDFEFASECLSLSGGMVLIRKPLGIYSWNWEEEHKKKE